MDALDPRNGDLSAGALKTYRNAGARRIVLFAQDMATEIADGAAGDWIERCAPIVERTRSLSIAVDPVTPSFDWPGSDRDVAKKGPRPSRVRSGS